MRKPQPEINPRGAVDPRFWAGRKVLVTGHTGFKGSWLSIWLAQMGAEVFGYALAAEYPDGLFTALDLPARLGAGLHHRIGDVRDLDALTQAVRAAQPEIIFHMAAQPLVRRSYCMPVETFSTNAQGTVHLLDAARACGGVGAIVIITTDKVYENTGDDQAYSEDDRLGGHDPYSASKAMAELAVMAWRRSFSAAGGPAIATARAGNVIGGGDWSEDRLIADAMRAWRADAELILRNPHATRPWQHVSDPLRGYLVLAQALAVDGARYGQAWNFGPEINSVCDVQGVIERLAAPMRAHDFAARWRSDPPKDQPHEAARLELDCSKAREELHWRPRHGLDAALSLTAEWYSAQISGASPQALFDLTLAQI
ncbi:MAG: CDP-glucose 4,6-dehydratase [Alphaproteobacteria bacterium]